MSRARRTFVVEIPGEVVAWKRARVVRLKGGRTVLTTATADRDYRAFVRRLAEQLVGAEKPLRGPVSCEVVASWGEGARVTATFSELQSGFWWPKAPDADNVAKGILDAVQGVLLEDDAQVVDLRVLKVVEDGQR